MQTTILQTVLKYNHAYHTKRHTKPYVISKIPEQIIDLFGGISNFLHVYPMVSLQEEENEFNDSFLLKYINDKISVLYGLTCKGCPYITLYMCNFRVVFMEIHNKWIVRTPLKICTEYTCTFYEKGIFENEKLRDAIENYIEDGFSLDKQVMIMRNLY